MFLSNLHRFPAQYLHVLILLNEYLQHSVLVNTYPIFNILVIIQFDLR